MDDERFWSKVDQSGGPDACWPWTRGTGSHGYGVYYLPGRHQVLTHRYALTQAIGPGKPGRHALHSLTCTTKRCCNPKHLRWGTHAENMNDASIAGVLLRAKPVACPKGHALTVGNIIHKQRRHVTAIGITRTYSTASCRECNRLYLARRRAERREQEALHGR